MKFEKVNPLLMLISVVLGFAVSINSYSQILNNNVIFIRDVSPENIKEIIEQVSNVVNKENKDQASEAATNAATEALNESGVSVQTSTNPDGNNTYVITVPIKNEEGNVVPVNINYTENSDTQSITIPGVGNITFVESGENGQFQLTPEQIEGAENVQCTGNTTGKATCVVEPLMIIDGNQVITSDKFELSYEEGKDFNLLSGTGSNFMVTNRDSQTEFTNSETSLGDVKINFLYDKEGTSSNAPVNNLLAPLGISNPVPSLPTPSEFKDSKKFTFEVTSSNLVNRVSDPNNPGQMLTRLEVKDNKGADARVVLNETDVLVSVATHSGVKYSSTPDSPNSSVTVDTNSPLDVQLAIKTDSVVPQATLSLAMGNTDRAGNRSQMQVIDRRDKGEVDSITVSGNTAIKINQVLVPNTDPKDPKFREDIPATFEIYSDDILIDSSKKNGRESSRVNISGVNGRGIIDSQNDRLTARVDADSFSKEKNKNGQFDSIFGFDGNVGYLLVEDKNVKNQTGQADYAYYRNDKNQASLDGNIFINVTDFKNRKEASTLGGVPVKRVSFASGDRANFQKIGEDKYINIDSGFVLSRTELVNGVAVDTLVGKSGEIVNDEYKIDINGPIGITNVSSKNNGDGTVQTTVTALELNGVNTESGDSFDIRKSFTDVLKLGKTPSGSDILQITQTAKGIDYKKGDGTGVATLSDSNLAMIDADEVKYGTISFSEGDFKSKSDDKKSEFDENIKILEADASFYVDKTNPDRKRQSGTLTAQVLDAKGADYSVKIEVPGSNGEAEKFRLMFFEDGPATKYSILNENGKKVNLEGLDKDGNIFKVLTKSIEYFESDDFKSVLGEKLDGRLETVDPNDKKIQEFTLGKVEGFESIDGKYRQLSIENGVLKENNLSEKTETFADIKNLAYTKNDKVQFGTVVINSGSFTDNNIAENGGVSENVIIRSADIVFFEDKTDPEKIVRNAKLKAESVSFEDKDYSVKVDIKGDDGDPKQYEIIAFEEGEDRYYRISNESGELVSIEALKSDGKLYEGLVQTLEYVKQGNLETLLADKISGTLSDTSGNDPKVQKFNIARLQGVKEINGNYETVTALASNGLITEVDPSKSSSGTVSFDSLGFYSSKESFEDGKFKQFELVNIDKGSVEYIDLEKEGKIDFKSLVGSRTTIPDGTDITYFDFGEASLSAIDYKENVSGSGAIGRLQGYKSENVDWMELDDLKNFKVEDLSNGSYGIIDGKKVKGVVIRSDDGKVESRKILIDQSVIRIVDPEKESEGKVTFETLSSFSQTEKFDDETSTKFEALSIDRGNIDFVDAKTQGDIEFSSFIGTRLTNRDNSKITYFDFGNASITAINVDDNTRGQGNIGRLQKFESDEVEWFELDDLKNFKVEDLESGAFGVIDGKKIKGVVIKDKNGEVLTRHILIDQTVITAKDLESEVDGKIDIKKLDVLEDKIAGRTILNEADVEFKINYSGSIPASISGALKGKLLEFNSGKEVSKDGLVKTQYAEVTSLDGGNLEKVELSAGPDFLQDFISIKAKGGENGRALRFSFRQDKKAGTYYLRAEFKDGEKVKVKLFPFELESKKNENDAVADLFLQAKGQNYLNHLSIIKDIIGVERLTNWLYVNDKTIKARLNVTKGSAFEVFYSKEDLWNPPHLDKDIGTAKKAYSIGANYVDKNKDGSENIFGIALTGDSEFAYSTNGKFKIFGIEQDPQGSIPGTIQFAYDRVTKAGNTYGLRAGTSIPTYAVDFDTLDENSEFYEGRRGKGGGFISAHMRKNLTETSRLYAGVGMYQDLQTPAAFVAYEGRFGAGPKLSDAQKVRRALSSLDLYLREERANILKDFNPDFLKLRNARDGKMSELDDAQKRKKDRLIYQSFKELSPAQKRKALDKKREEISSELLKKVNTFRLVYPGSLLISKLEKKLIKLYAGEEGEAVDPSFVIENMYNPRALFDLTKEELEKLNQLFGVINNPYNPKIFDELELLRITQGCDFSEKRYKLAILNMYRKQLVRFKEQFPNNSPQEILRDCRKYHDVYLEISNPPLKKDLCPSS